MMTLFIILIAWGCVASQGGCIPSSRRNGVVRVFGTTPPGSPKTPKTPPVVPYQYSKIEEGKCFPHLSRTRRLSDSDASTTMDSDEEVSVNSVMSDEIVPPGLDYRNDTNWWRALLRFFKIK